MSKYLLSTQEVYRADSEAEATALIEEAKKENGFELAKYGCVYRERKQKGEVVDSYYKVTLVKGFTDEKEPTNDVEVSYKERSAFDIEDTEKEVVFHATI